jgi:hypothetical protein
MFQPPWSWVNSLQHQLNRWWVSATGQVREYVKKCSCPESSDYVSVAQPSTAPVCILKEQAVKLCTEFTWCGREKRDVFLWTELECWGFIKVGNIKKDFATFKFARSILAKNLLNFYHYSLKLGAKKAYRKLCWYKTSALKKLSAKVDVLLWRYKFTCFWLVFIFPGTFSPGYRKQPGSTFQM